MVYTKNTPPHGFMFSPQQVTETRESDSGATEIDVRSLWTPTLTPDGSWRQLTDRQFPGSSSSTAEKATASGRIRTRGHRADPAVLGLRYDASPRPKPGQGGRQATSSTAYRIHARYPQATRLPLRSLGHLIRNVTGCLIPRHRVRI